MNDGGGYDLHNFPIVKIRRHWIIMDGKTLMGSHTENNTHPAIPLGFSLAHVAYYLATSECGDHLVHLFGAPFWWGMGTRFHRKFVSIHHEEHLLEAGGGAAQIFSE